MRLPLLEVSEANLVEAVCANGNDTTKDGETRQVLTRKIALVSNGLVASGRRKIPVDSRRKNQEMAGRTSECCRIAERSVVA